MFMKVVLMACCPMPFSTMAGAKHHIRLCQTDIHKLIVSHALCTLRPGLLNKTACLELKVTVYTDIKHMIIVTYYYIVYRG